MLLRYMERLHLSYRDAIKEPWSVIERAFFVWSLDGERDKLEVRRQEHKRRTE